MKNDVLYAHVHEPKGVYKMSQANNTFGTPDNTVGNLNGLFKEVYADKLNDLIPDGVKLLNRIKFSSKDKSPGNLFHQPVVLGKL